MVVDGELKDGSLSDQQETEPMETSTGAALSLLGKRRAETPNPEDSSESDGGDYEGVEDDGESGDTEPEWGYDSFEDRKYDSADQMVYEDKEFEKQCRYCRRQLIETEGFYEPSDRFPPYSFGGVSPMYDLEEVTGRGRTGRELLASLTSACLKRYNEEKGLNVKLEHIIRANFKPNSMSTFYITFGARESDCPDAPLVEYQAKAAWSVANKTYPIFCRPSPPPKILFQFSVDEYDGRDQLKEVTNGGGTVEEISLRVSYGNLKLSGCNKSKILSN